MCKKLLFYCILLYSGLTFCQTANLNGIINLFEEECATLPIEKNTKYRNTSIKAMINTYSMDSYFTKNTNRDLAIFRSAYGDKAADIQQITGSLLQTGSMTVIGNISASVGGFSGSFQGDGTLLTGVV